MNNDEFEEFRDRMYEMVRYLKKSGYYMSEDNLSTIAENYAQCLKGMAEKVGVDNVLRIGQLWVRKDVSDRHDAPKPAQLLDMCSKEYSKLLKNDSAELNAANINSDNKRKADAIVKCVRVLNNAEQLKQIRALSEEEYRKWLEANINIDFRSTAEDIIKKGETLCWLS